MTSMETNYHGLHDYSTFSSSTIKNTNDDEGQQPTNCFCFLCRLSASLILHPVGPFRCCWDLFVMILLIYTSVEIPYTVSFGQSEFIQYIGLFVDGFLLFDIFLNFHTAYFDRYDNLRLVTNKKYICKKYFRTWFLIDFLTSIPFEFIFNRDLEETDGTSSALFYIKILRIFRLARIIKILRFVKMLRIFDAFMKQFIIREVVVMMKLFKIIFGMLMFAHFAACLWWFVGSRTLHTETWIDDIEQNKGIDLRNDDYTTFQKYSFAWYWAVVTLFTTGYGDIVATNTIEQWVCSICILIGTCFFAYFVGTLTVLITEGDRIKSYELEKLEEAQSFCEKKKLPKELTRAILTHIRYHCTYNYVFDESSLLDILPSYLQHDIHTFAARRYLQQLHIFQNEYINLPDFIIGLIAVKCRSISCNGSFKLYDVGDFAKTFYIQRTGRSTMYDKNGKVLHELCRGSVCGEFSSILFKRRRLKVQCKTWSEFYSINIDDIKDILHLYYPKSAISKWKQIKKYVKSAYDSFVKHSVDINNSFNYERIQDNVSFNGASMHSMFSFHRSNTNINSGHNSNRSLDHHVQFEESLHLFDNNARSRNNSAKTSNSGKRSSNSDKRSSIHLANIAPKDKASSPIPPQTPVTPQPNNAADDIDGNTHSFDNFPSSQITIITAGLSDGHSNGKVQKLSKNRTRAQSRSFAVPRNASSSNLQRVSTPKLNQFTKKLHMRSNSEIRDMVVVTHAEKHQRISTPKFNNTNTDLFKGTNHTAIKRTTSLRQFVSEPMRFFANPMEIGVIEAHTTTREGVDDGLTKSTSIRSGYTEFDEISDSEISSVYSDTESDDDHKFSRHNTESNKDLLGKKKAKKKQKKVKKKKKGKGKFGGARGRGSGTATKQRVNRIRSPHHKHHKQHHNNNKNMNDNIDNKKNTKLFEYNNRNASDHSDGDNDNENISRATSIDPSVLLAPLSSKMKSRSIEDSVINTNSSFQNIQNININIGGNTLVMTPDYDPNKLTDDNDNDYDDDDIVYDDNDKDNEDTDELETPAMPVINSNIESI